MVIKLTELLKGSNQIKHVQEHIVNVKETKAQLWLFVRLTASCRTPTLCQALYVLSDLWAVSDLVPTPALSSRNCYYPLPAQGK